MDFDVDLPEIASFFSPTPDDPHGLSQDCGGDDGRSQADSLLSLSGLSPDVGALVDAFGDYAADAVGANNDVLQVDEVTIVGDPKEADPASADQRKREYAQGVADGANLKPRRNFCTMFDADYDAGYEEGARNSTTRRTLEDDRGQHVEGRIINYLDKTSGIPMVRTKYVRGTKAELDVQEQDEQRKISAAMLRGMLQPAGPGAPPNSAHEPRAPTHQEPPR